MFTRTSVLVMSVLLAAATLAEAKDAYFDIAVRDLKLVEGQLPKPDGQTDWRNYQRTQMMRPYAVLDGPGEAYLPGPGANGEYWSNNASGLLPPALTLRLRAPEGQDVKGRLVVAKSDRSGMDVLRFVVPASAAKPEAKVLFYQAKLDYYSHQSARNIPGGAWFRHQERLAQAELKLPYASSQPAASRGPFFGDSPESTYDLFTGGRAISENLQFDRALPARPVNETPVKIDSIAGITIKEIDWKPLIKNAEPELDPLAAKIPFDQHAVFFPSFQAALAVADETKKHDTPLLRLAEPRAEDAGVVERYQRQLGLPLNDLARLLGPRMVKSVALTGSDPSFPLGTDVAVLFETPRADGLKNALSLRIAVAARKFNDVEASDSNIDGLAYYSFISDDRQISSYIAQLDGAVVVTNSLYQLKRLAAVRGGKVKSVAELPEYKFFRIRYPRGDADESALIFLSDATIRRWCGPRWRIADSRRTRARAVLAELQASQVAALVEHKVEAGPIHTDLPILGGGELRLTPEGVVSSVYGTLDFMTPVGELDLDEVTKAEADSYAAWRDGYQRNWNWSFDPIGLRIGLGKNKLAADLTIMPLIINSDYNRFFEISQGAAFGPAAGDPHAAIVHLIVALNHESQMFRQGESLFAMVTGGRNIALGWIGPSISLYADDDPFWDDLAKVGRKNNEKYNEKEVEDFLGKNVGRTPVALRIDSTSPLQLAAFLASVRGYIEQTGPGLTAWETLKYKDQAYVRVSPVKGQPGISREMEDVAIYYTTVGGALTVTLSEQVLKHVIERAAEKSKNKSGGEIAADGMRAKPQAAWLGSNVGLHVDHRILEIANALGRDQYQDHMQALSWSNLPVLNEWKRLFPDRDPVAVHRELWGTTLVCPGGGKYVWNADYGTMESTVYGHPGQPKAGPPAPPVLSVFSAADFGLTLENDGLRARVELQR